MEVCRYLTGPTPLRVKKRTPAVGGKFNGRGPPQLGLVIAVRCRADVAADVPADMPGVYAPYFLNHASILAHASVAASLL